MALITEAKLLTDIALQNRVTMSTLHSANSVIAEDPGVPNHDNRVALAKAVMLDPNGFTRSFYNFVIIQPGIVENGADQTKIDDETIMYAVSLLWDTVASLMVGTTPMGMMVPPPPPLPPPMLT